MINQNNYLTNMPEWLALIQHQADISRQHMREWFRQDSTRPSQYLLRVGDLCLDYSRNRINQQTIPLLCHLAEAVGLRDKIDALFTGQPVNVSEKRPALHTALRDHSSRPLLVGEENVTLHIQDARKQLDEFVMAIQSGQWTGVSGKPIRHIINIGIGGSYLGPKMATEALKDFAINTLSFHYISSVDKAQLRDVFDKIDPETSLFIISSKSFGTLETMTNAKTAHEWMKSKLGKSVLANHFVAITAAAEKAHAFGIPEKNIFPLWDWVGGRYSIWSAISLPLMLMIGRQQFNEFLSGAYEIDQHFRTAPFAENLPVIMALLTIWYVNLFKTGAQAVVPYAYRLRHLISYLQQAEMESNGKNVSKAGQPLDYLTCPVIFGEEGCNGQHAYHQLLHQGQHLIPVDFILLGHTADTHQDIMRASGLSQAQALMQGKTVDEAYKELQKKGLTDADAKSLAPHLTIPGNRPSNILYLKELNPKNLGALLAIYEHKIFVTGAIWDINSFDQWGVELGKQLLPDILDSLHEKPDQLVDFESGI